MTTKLEQAARQALEAMEEGLIDDKWYAAKDAMREALAEQAEQEPVAEVVLRKQTVGFGRTEERKDVMFLADVEVGQKLYAAPVQQAEKEPFDMNDHPPHRLCECRKCMEYFTPLPDCDAFAASGKPIAEQTNTQLMEGYRIGLAEMREKCAKVAERFEPDEKCSYVEYASASIRAIKFEGDTGFRPVSEMIAEHKQDPKKAAAIEKAKMRKAEKEPLMDYERINALREGEQNGAEDAYFFVRPENDTPSLRKMFCQGFERGFYKGLKYASHVRTKDLTDDEIVKVTGCEKDRPLWLTVSSIARAVIAADREKNRG